MDEGILFHKRSQTMLMYSLIVLTLCVLGFVVTSRILSLYDRWMRIPHFYGYTVGKVTARCGTRAFAEAIAEGRFVTAPNGTRLVTVPETLAFSLEEGAHFSGKAEMFFRRILPCPDVFHSEDTSLLFVPFTSERCMSFREQAAFFTKPPVDINAFVETQKERNRRADFRLRFVHFLEGSRHEFLVGLQAMCAGFGLVALVSACIFGLMYMDARDDEEEVVIHTTTPGTSTVNVLHATAKEAARLPLSHELFGRGNIWKGRFMDTKNANLGGNASWVCVELLGRRVRCGFADSSLTFKGGDIVYIRGGSVLLWEEVIHRYRDNTYWVITEQEALALVKDAGFSLIE